MSSASARILPLVGRALRGIFWTALFAVLAAGGAGLVGQAWHPPGSPARAELTYPGDAALDARLDAATAGSPQIADEVEALADEAKTALAEVTSRDPTRLREARRARRCRRPRRSRPGPRSCAWRWPTCPATARRRPIEYSNATLVRRSTVLAAIDAASGLAVHWRQVAARATETANLMTLIARHDQTVLAAAADGRDSAVATRDPNRSTRRSSIVADVQTLRARLIAGSDGTVLDEWIQRNGDYDAALRNLYRALRDCSCPGGPFTVEVQFAYRDEELARRAAPARPADDHRHRVRGHARWPDRGRDRDRRRPRPHRRRAGRGARHPSRAPHRARQTADGRRCCTTLGRHSWSKSPPLKGVSVQVKVVADQPWDVKADVLAVPILGEPAFTGPLGELDRRAGGELQSLADFGELKGKRFKSVLAGAGKAMAGRLVAVARGRRRRARSRDRGQGRRVARSAAWPGARSDRSRSGSRRSPSASRAARPPSPSCVARGVVEGSYDPATIYRDGYTEGPPALDELILVAPGEEAAALSKAAEKGVIMGEGANIARTLSNRASNDVSPEVLAEEAYTLAKKHGLWIDVIGPEKATDMGMGLFMAVGRGSDNPPRMIVMRSGKAGEKDAPRPAPRDRRQGRLLRLRRHLDQAIRPDGRDEDGQDRRLHRHRRRGHRRPARAGHPAPRPRPGGREHARPALDPARRRRQGAQRQDGRHHQHGRRGPAHPGRRADLRRAPRRDAPRRRRDPHRRGGPRAGRAHERRVRDAPGVRRRRLRRGREGRRAVLAAAADRRVPRRHGQLVRRPRELLAQQRGRPREERDVHPGVRHEAVGPPRHRRAPAYFRKVAPYAARGSTGVSHATLVELALAGAKA